VAHAAKESAATGMSDLSNCSASEPFALRVIGNDMAPEFADGNIIIVDPGGKISSGCYVIARHQDEMIFRQLIIEQGTFSLRALDTSLAEIALPNGIEDIVGVISQRSGPRRSQHKRYDV
jgi:SOS-response transcriptional repressor LexA